MLSLKFKLSLLFCIGFLLYLPTFGNAFLWDDEQFIYRNTYVREFNVAKIFTENTIAGAGENSNYYRPLTTLSFAIDHALWGLRPFGFHLTNTVLHSLNGVLLYILLSQLQLFPQPPLGKKLRHLFTDFPFLISGLFLIHPLQTEAVTYVNSRGDSLYLFFLFLGLSTFHYLFSFKPHNQALKIGDIILDIPAHIMYVFPPLFYLLAILSKEIALAGLGLYALIFLRHQLSQGLQFSFSHVSCFMGTIGVAISYVGLRTTVLNFANIYNFYNGSNLYTDSVLTRFITFTYIFWDYLRLLILPYPLHMERDPAVHVQLLNPATVMFLMLVMGLGLLTYWEWRKHRTLVVFFGVSWFFIMISLVSGFVPINGLMYEHWLYAPMIGFWIVLAQMYLFIRPHLPDWFISILAYGYLFVMVIFISLTLRQNYIWRHPIPFYEYTLRYANSPRLHNNLAMAYDEAGRYQDAIREYQAAFAEIDAYPQVHYNLANTYIVLQQFDQAEAEYLQALEIDPNFYLSHQELIDLYMYQKRYDEAARHVDFLLQVAPTNSVLLQLKKDLDQKK